jgi:hypothetical protein
MKMPHRRSESVRFRHRLDAPLHSSDRGIVRLIVQDSGVNEIMGTPWALEMKAVSSEEPGRLIETLTDAILGSGGWVLSRRASAGGIATMLFEFERRACVDVYSALVGAGVELVESDHTRFTELCQCTLGHRKDCADEIASIDLMVETVPRGMAIASRASLTT